MIEFENIFAAIKEFTLESDLNRSVDKSYKYFDEPLVACADINDSIFAAIKEAISPEYLTPAEWLRLAGDERDIQTGTVISWVLPVSKYVRESNRQEKNLPSEPWAHVRFYGEKFNQALREHLINYLQAENFLSIAPSSHESWKYIYSPKVGHASNWSERHAAYAAGLGTFSLNDGLITERGIAHRVGSIITTLKLQASPRNYTGLYDNCLYYRSGKCGVCVNRCPAHAITKERGHDKDACFEYTRKVVMPTVNDGYGVTTPSCGLCQTRVPCEYKIPS